MKKAKLNSNKKVEKKEELVTDQSMSVKGVVITFVSIIIVFISFYFITVYILDNQPKTNIYNGDTQNKSDYIAFNELLKQEDDTYYVFAMLENDENEDKYDKYFEISPIEPVYYIDMSDTFNKNHIGEETNISDKVKEIVITDTTLFAIKNGEIESYHIGYDEILEYLISSM